MPITNHAELVSQLRQTRAMIDADPTWVVIRRTTRTRDNLTGGLTSDVDDLPPQKVRLLYGYVGRRGRMNEPDNVSMIAIPYSKDTLMGDPDLDVERGDTFVVDGVTYRVSYVYENREYEILANIENSGQPQES